MAGERNWSGAGVLASVPWCCIAPALISFLGVAGSLSARLWVGQATPFLLVFSAGALLRANYLAWIRRRGTRWSRAVVVISSILALSLWLPRFVSF